MTKIFFVGEDSHLARELADELERRGMEMVNSYSHPCDGFRTRHSDRARILELDGAGPTIFGEIHKADPDIVINCAGLVNSGKCYQHELEAHRSNTLTAQYVAGAVKSHPNMKLVHFGTTASYRNPWRISEETPPTFFHTAYSLTKLLGEQMVASIIPSEQLLNIRPVFVYGGVHDNSSVISLLARRQFTGEHPEISINLDADKKKAPLYVTDFVEAVAELIEIKATGPYVVGHPTLEPKYGEVRYYLKRLGVVDQNIIWCPNEDSLENHLPDVTKLLTDTELTAKGWPRVDLEEGLRRVVEAYA